MKTTSIKPCILIVRYTDHLILKDYIYAASKYCDTIILAGNVSLSHKIPVTLLNIDGNDSPNKAIFLSIALAKEKKCTHILTLDVDEYGDVQEIELFLQQAQENPLAILVGKRDFNQKNIAFSKRLERVLSIFWMRVQTGVKLHDIHHSTKCYPVEFFEFVKLKNYGYSFDAESLVRAAWGGFSIIELMIKTRVSSARYCINIKTHLGMIALNVKLTMRALVPLPYRRYDYKISESISLRHPVFALRYLMNDPYNRATPWQLAKTAGISMAILTLPAPIIQSVFLLLCIGWLKLNRLCALAMIPLTWPPFLPGLAVLVGYRLRHGHWLSEFSIQTLGYEVGERLFEWVIGSMFLTPILGIILGIIVGFMALCLNKHH